MHQKLGRDCSGFAYNMQPRNMEWVDGQIFRVQRAQGHKLAGALLHFDDEFCVSNSRALTCSLRMSMQRRLT